MAMKGLQLLLAIIIALSWSEAVPVAEDVSYPEPIFEDFSDAGCDVDEFYNDEAPGCEPTCDDPNPQFCLKGISKCNCIQGYVREVSLESKCIRIEDCPHGNSAEFLIDRAEIR